MNSAAQRSLVFDMERLTCDVRGLEADAAAVDALARLQLAARRVGAELRLCHASAELRCLLVFCGLDEVLGLEPERQPEERKERLGVEEEGELPNPAA
jgi:anti-anti-sigma regulatory factor